MLNNGSINRHCDPDAMITTLISALIEDAKRADSQSDLDAAFAEIREIFHKILKKPENINELKEQMEAIINFHEIAHLSNVFCIEFQNAQERIAVR